MKYAIILLVMFTAACSNNPTERAVSGAAVGGLVGLGVGALVGSPRTGAAIGATGGAILGATTTEKDIDLAPGY